MDMLYIPGFSFALTVPPWRVLRTIDFDAFEAATEAGEIDTVAFGMAAVVASVTLILSGKVGEIAPETAGAARRSESATVARSLIRLLPPPDIVYLEYVDRQQCSSHQ